jgi:GDP-4-dehydro-6-deoxy-D-mannose reductase
MRVLIVGATGFVGAHLLCECRSRGDELWATHRPGEAAPDSGGVRWLPVDVLDERSIREALAASRAEGLVHLAGQAKVAVANRDPIGTFRINAEGTYRVLHAMRELAPDARAVVAGSAEAYGVVPAAELPVRETRPLAPTSPYGASKAAADLVAGQAAVGWGLDVVRMRPFNHVGPGQRRGFVAPDFASQVAAIERGEAEPVLRVGNLSGRRDFTDVRDVARAYRDAIDRGRRGEAYNLCSGRPAPIEEIVRFFVDRADVDIEVRPDVSLLRPVDVPEFLGSPEKARAELGWAAEIPLETSLADVLEEWRRLRVAQPADDAPEERAGREERV